MIHNPLAEREVYDVAIMYKLLTFLQYFFTALAVVLLVAAGVCYYYETDEPGAYVDDVDREFTNLSVGEHTVKFTLHNPTRHKVRVVGLGTC